MSILYKHKKVILISILLIISTIFLAVYINRSNQMAFPIYTGDVDTYKRQQIAEVYVDQEASKEEILVELTKGLYEYVFKLPVTFVGIETIFGQSVAVIDLKENTENDSVMSWRSGYFQGSTGGAVTSVSLSETMLQKEYNGDWIDGVKFLYECEPVAFEHVEGLSATLYRTTPYVLKDLDVGDALLEHFKLKSKSISENGREVYYELDGEFDANVRVYYNAHFPNAWVEILESPIRTMTIEVGFVVVGLDPYFENFRYYTHISNKDVFLNALKEDDPETYAHLMETGYADVSVKLGAFNSWLLAESEYFNSADFIEFIE